MKFEKITLAAAVSAVTLATSNVASSAETVTEALTSGKAFGDVRLRYEDVDQDTRDGSALTLRTRIGYTTGSLNGFSATAEFEDVRVVLGEDDYNAAGLNGNTTDSVIADPEVSELDQAFLQYKNDTLTAKIGRQVFTLDDHRFVGHVAWRQDRQTFDALSIKLTPTEDFTFTAAYLDQRNRIFAEARDIDSQDIILHAAYKTPVGPLKAYSYMLDVEDVDNAENDTLGVSFAPKLGPVKLHLEYATQETAANEADYLRLEVSGKTGPVMLKAGYELLGSDDGNYGFSTPLATLHKFNGWADAFLATPAGGLEDTYFSVSGKLAGGKAAVIYHTFSSDEGDAVDADEIDLLYTKKFGKNYYAGAKVAMFSPDGGTDVDKFWLWVGASF